jgi:hypothetical protein
MLGCNRPSSFRGEDWNIKSLTTDGRQVMTKTCITLWVRWAKKKVHITVKYVTIVINNLFKLGINIFENQILTFTFGYCSRQGVNNSSAKFMSPSAKPEMINYLP